MCQLVQHTVLFSAFDSLNLC